MNLLNYILAGNVAEILEKEKKDYIVKLLESYNHKGIVIGGCNPWYVGVVTSGVNK